MSEDEVEDEDTIVYIFLWETNKDIFDIYGLLRNYLSSEYAIDSALLLALIKDNALPVTRTIAMISYIHYSYVNVILPAQTTKDTS